MEEKTHVQEGHIDSSDYVLIQKWNTEREIDRVTNKTVKCTTILYITKGREIHQKMTRKALRKEIEEACAPTNK